MRIAGRRSPGVADHAGWLLRGKCGAPWPSVLLVAVDGLISDQVITRASVGFSGCA